MFRSSMVEHTTDNRVTQVRFLSKQPNSGIEEFGRPRQFHMLEIIGSNPIPASKYRASGIFEDLAWFLLRGRGATP